MLLLVTTISREPQENASVGINEVFGLEYFNPCVGMFCEYLTKFGIGRGHLNECCIICFLSSFLFLCFSNSCSYDVLQETFITFL